MTTKNQATLHDSVWSLLEDIQHLAQSDGYMAGGKVLPTDRKNIERIAEEARSIQARLSRPPSWLSVDTNANDETANLAGMEHGIDAYNESRGCDASPLGPCGHHCYGTDCPCMHPDNSHFNSPNYTP